MSEDSFELSYVFNHPRDLVFKTWSQKEHLNQWWGPKGSTMHTIRLDFKPNGIFHYQLKSSEGMEMWGKFVYKEIIPPQKIVFISSFSDKNGNTTRGPFDIDFPLEILNIVTFVEYDGKTTMSLIATPINPTDSQRKTFDDLNKSMQQGYTGTFEQLTEYLMRHSELA